MYDLDTFYGPNAGYVLELYERYRQNPASVDPDTRAIFDSWSPLSVETPPSASPTAEPAAQVQVAKIIATSNLAHAIRSRGHLGAHLDPLGSEPLGDPALLTETYMVSATKTWRNCRRKSSADTRLRGRATRSKPLPRCEPCIRAPSATSSTR